MNLLDNMNALSSSFFCIFFEEMQATLKEMDDAKVPQHRRDYCAHVYIPLMKCRKENYYLPWRCQHERHAWHECEYEE